MSLTIGELARRTGVKVPTIRYYEDVGLLPKPARTEGRQRRYGDTEAARLSFVRRVRDLGFEVEAIRELLALTEQPDRSCEDVDVIAWWHLAEVETRIRHLSALRGELRRMLDECGHGRVGECRVIDAISLD